MQIIVHISDAGRDAVLKQVEGKNSDIIGTVCAVIVSATFAIVLILDMESIKKSLTLLCSNLRCSDQQ